MFVEVEKEEVDWEPLVELYVEGYGEHPANEAAKRRNWAAAEGGEEAAPAAEAAADGASDNNNDSDNNDDSDEDGVSGGEEPPSERQRPTPRQTRGRRKQTEIDALQQSMPSASVFIEMSPCLWPGESAQITDGVEEVFLQSDSDDPDDDTPLGQVFGSTNADGEWSREACNAMRAYASGERYLQDAEGKQLDLAIDDPKANASED